MANYLVAGGAGFIGSNIAEKLVKDGHFVRVFDNFSSGKEENLEFAQGLGKDKFEILRGDIRDQTACEKACHGMDFVLLQAALRSVPKSFTDPLEYNDVNINGIFQMLQASVKNKVKRFVFASSSSVYGDSESFPLRETQLPLLISPYALTKLAGEYYCRIFTENYKLPTVCLRYFNVFGPKQALDDEYAVVVPKFITCLLNDQPTPIFGNGQQSRDFTYIDNVVSANILATTAADIKHEVVNVANGESKTVLDLVDALNRILGKNIKPVFLPPRQGDIFRTESDISRISKVLNYRPVVKFEEGLKRTVDHFKKILVCKT